MCGTQSEFDYFYGTRFVEEPEIKKLSVLMHISFTEDMKTKPIEGYRALSNEQSLTRDALQKLS